jgi:actin-related protein
VYFFLITYNNVKEYKEKLGEKVKEAYHIPTTKEEMKQWVEKQTKRLQKERYLKNLVNNLHPIKMQCLPWQHLPRADMST